MATVRMKKGDKYADVYDSPETIKQAQTEGFSLVKSETVDTEDASETKDTKEATTKTYKKRK